MTSDRFNTGPKVFLKSLSTAEEGREWRLVHFSVTYIGWFLLLFVYAAYLVSSEVRARGPWVLGWLLSCLVYLVVREVFSRTKRELYGTSQFRMVRIQIVVFLGSALLWMTGGAESYFWFIYLWPLFASALYFPRGMMWGIYGEVVVLYFLASLSEAAGLALINPVSLFTNLAVLLVLTAIFRYLVESIRKYQTAERALGYSELLQHIQKDVDAAVDLQEVLDRILQRAVDLVGARDGSLMLMEEDGRLHFRARVGGLVPVDKAERTFTPGAPDEGIAGWVARNREPYVCRDTKTDTHFVDIIAGGVPIRSLVSVPIMSHGTALGVINVDSLEPNCFSAADVELLIALADQVAVAIERAELLESLKKIGEKTLGGAVDLYQYIVDAVHRLTRCPVSMWRVDEPGDQARIIASRGISIEYAQEARLDLGHSVTGKAIRERRIIQVLDIQANPGFQKKEEATREGWQSMLAVPLLAGPERAVGTLSVYSMTKREEFTPWEIDLLGTFASQAGVAIQNSERLQTIQRLNKVGQSLATLQESPEVLQETLEQIANTAIQVLGADVVDLYQYQADREDFALPPIMVGDRRFPHLIPTQVFPDDVVFQIAHTGGKVYASDAQKHAVLAGDWDFPREELPQERFVVRERVISSAAVSMKVGEEVLGVMFVGYRQRCDFDTDLELRERIEVLANQGAIAINNARLVQGLRDRADEVSLLQQISAQISAALKLDKILPSLVEGAMRLTKTKSGVVHVIDSSGERIVGSYAYPEEFRHPAPRISEQGYTRLIIEKGEQRVVPDTHVDTRANPEVVEKGVRSFVGTPLKSAGERAAGVLYLNDIIVRQFTEEELALLRALADQAAVAIEHAQLFQELDERATQLEQLQTVTTAISAEPSNLERVSHLIVKSLSDIFHKASCAIRLYDSTTDQFRPQIATGVMEEWIDRLPRPDGTSCYVVRTKLPRYLEGNDVATPSDGGPAVREDISALGMKSVAYLPLISGGDVVGVLYVNLTVPHHFSDNDKLLLELFADQAAIAIENARLYQNLERRIRELEVLTEIGRTVSSLGIDEILEEIHTQAGKLMDVRNIQIAFYDEDKDGVSFPLAYDAGKKVEADHKDFRPRRRGEYRYGLTEYVIDKGEAEISRGNVWKWAKERGIQLSEAIATKSWIGTPLRVWDREKQAEKVIGLISIQSYEKEDAYDENDLRVLETMASQAAVAIENARLLDRETRRARQLAGLQEIGVKITSQLELGEVLGSVVENANMTTSADFSTLFLYDPEQDKFESGIRRGKVEVAPSIPGHTGFSAHIARTQEAVFAEDVGKEPRVKPTFIRNKRVKSFAGVPLIFGGRTVGLLYVNFFESRGFSKSDRETIHLLANQAAVAIENARLYTEMEQRVEKRTRQLREAQEKALAAEVNAAVGLVTAEMAHHSKNLSGIIRSCALRLIQQLQDLTPQQQEDLDNILLNSEGINKAAEDLFKPFRPEPKAKVSINLVLNEALAALGKQPDMDIQANLAPDLPAVNVQVQKIITYIVELLSNAVKFTRRRMSEEGIDLDEIRVDGQLAGDGFVELAFMNHGPPIPHEHWEEIFNLFSARQEVAQEEQSYGLGLWGARTTMREHGGEVSVLESNEERTIFLLRLPAQQQQEEE